MLDSRVNPILAYSLNQEYVNLLSLSDIRHIANAFLVLGKSLCHLRNKKIAAAQAKGTVPSLIKLDDQKVSLKICSYLIVGMEAACRVKDYYLLKLMIIQIYNTLTDFFQSETQSPLLLHALIKCHVALTIIPSACLDSATRSVASCISYQIAINTLQIHESKLLGTTVSDDLLIMKRRWLTKTVTKVVPPQPLTEEQIKLREEQQKMIAEGKEVKEEDLVNEPEPTEESAITLYESEKEGEAADEFFLTLAEHNEKVALNANKLKQILKEYVEIVTDGENVVNTISAKIDGVVEFWKSVAADPYAALDQLINNGKEGNEKYLEFCCKCIRRVLEADGWSEDNDLIAKTDSVELDEEIKKTIEDSLEEQKKQLTNDVLERAVKRLQVLEQVCAGNNETTKEAIKDRVGKTLLRQKSEDIGPSTETNEHDAENTGKREKMKWLAELHFLKGAAQFEKFKKLFSLGKCKGNANYFDIKQLDLERIKLLLEEDDEKLKKKEPSEDEKLLKEIVETHTKGTLYALKSGALIVLHNLIVQLWNVLLYVQVSPALHKKIGTWAHVVIMSYCVVSIIGKSKTGEKQVRFKEDKKEKKECLGLYANVISYAIQCLLTVEKWQSLADLCQRFIAKTQNDFGGFLLPFAIYSQNVLYTRSEQNTIAKRNELQARVEAFEKWAATKKKKSRAAMITGEIPPEEQEFIKDKAKLLAEIMKLEIIQEFFAEDKHKNDELLALIKRDSNTAKEALTNCRKALVDYAQKTCEILAEERSKGVNNNEVKKLRKVHQLITNKVISSYKKTIEILRERQENFMLVQSLHELGNIYFAENQLKESEINWSDSLDTVYQELYALINFKALIKRVPNLVAKFGLKPCLTSLILLSKLHKFSYGYDLQRLGQAVDMSLYICFEPFKLSMPHPQQFNLFALYKCTELLPVSLLF